MRRSLAATREAFMKTGGWWLLALALAGCGDNAGPSAPTAGALPTPAPGFELRVDNASLSAPLGCASTLLTASAEQSFSGTVDFDCVGQPPGLKCGFGSRPSLSAGAATRVGFTLNADPSVPNGTHSFQVRGRSGGGERTAGMQISLSRSAVVPTSGAMTVTGCAGYLDGVLGSGFLQSYLSTFVGAYKNNRGTFCIQTLADGNGAFVLRVPAGCFQGGEPIYWTTGGGETCVITPFRSGELAHVDLLGGRRSCP
jgi:hypothetical protein